MSALSKTTALLLLAITNISCGFNYFLVPSSRMASSRVRMIQQQPYSHRPTHNVPSSSSLQVSTTTPLEQQQPAAPPFPIVLWRFTRPHTLIGSALAIPALHILAASSYADAFSGANLIAALFAMVPSLMMNLYITGLNQITDVEIDKINKPNLPIAAGDLSRTSAIGIVLLALGGSLLMGVSHPVLGSQGLNVALWGSMILGTLYSLPPFRLKRFPLLAATCIVAVRGTIINAGFFSHARSAAFGDTTANVLSCLFQDPVCRLSCLFFGIFGIVIALMKDVPDVRGDALANVRTFSVRLGQKKIFHGARKLLMGMFFAYGLGFLRSAIMAVSFSSSSGIRVLFRSLVGVASISAGISVGKKAEGVEPENPQQVYDFYMHLWKLFYLSYLFLPFAK